MTFSETLTLAAYFFVLIILSVYGWHRHYLVFQIGFLYTGLVSIVQQYAEDPVVF